MEDKLPESSTKVDIAASIHALLDAIEQLGDELASRDQGDLTFRVSVPDDPPAIRILAELINDIGDSIDQHLQTGEVEMLRRTKELTQAYNAMQEQSEEMRKELEMARRIQERLLPQQRDMPDRPEIACAGFYVAMSNVGGDLYDIIRVGKNSYAILIADVSGHGIPAALITALVKIAFRSRTYWGVSPDDVCRQVNEELVPILGDLDYFVTAWFGIIDLETGKLRYTNAGHDPAILMRTDGNILKLDSGGRFLGQFEDLKYKFEEIALQEEDMLLLYTDGIIEARNMLDVEYGFDNLEKCLRDSSFANASELISVINKDLDAFCMGAQQRDDISMLAVDFRHAIIPADNKPEADTSEDETVQLVGGRDRLARDMGREAAILIRANRRAEAAAMLESALVLVPGEPLLLLRMAALQIMEKNWTKAETTLQGIINPLALSDELLKQFERLSSMVKAKKG